jgi:hypothetical protein
MSKVAGLGRAAWIAIWVVAIIVTLVGGSWHDPTPATPNWKFNIQLPGIYVVLLIVWFMGPLLSMMTAP